MSRAPLWLSLIFVALLASAIGHFAGATERSAAAAEPSSKPPAVTWPAVAERVATAKHDARAVASELGYKVTAVHCAVKNVPGIGARCLVRLHDSDRDTDDLLVSWVCVEGGCWDGATE